MNAIEDATWKPCETCGGLAVVSTVYTGGIVPVYGCPNCRDEDGKPTGLAFPQLSKKCGTCGGSGTVWNEVQPSGCIGEPLSCPDCQGRGRIRKAKELLEDEMEREEA